MTLTLALGLGAQETVSNAGDAPQGEFTIEDMEVRTRISDLAFADTSSAHSVDFILGALSAQLNFDNLWFVIYETPNVKVNYENLHYSARVDDYYAVQCYGKISGLFLPDTFEAALELASLYGWNNTETFDDAAQEGNANPYAAKFAAELTTLENLEIDFGAALAFGGEGDSAPIGFGVSAE